MLCNFIPCLLSVLNTFSLTIIITIKLNLEINYFYWTTLYSSIIKQHKSSLSLTCFCSSNLYTKDTNTVIQHPITLTTFYLTNLQSFLISVPPVMLLILIMDLTNALLNSSCEQANFETNDFVLEVVSKAWSEERRLLPWRSNL